MNSLDQTCSRCGARLPSRLLDGLCEACLLRFSLGVGGPPSLVDDAAGASLFDLLEPSLPATARIFGDYELLEEIGAGGMGVVWRGRQRSLNRLVAVKMIRAGQLARPDDIRRFRTEAEAVARLQHPGIVAIHEIGEVDGQHFFSMELVEGASLAQITRQAPLPPRRAATLVQGLAATIHHAHSRGVLHRDLKPSNILFDANDQPHVTDFGLAKVAGSASDVTSTNAIVGSPGYMAPEQASGHSRDVDGRADLHALGAILYELLTGRPPFQADSAMATLKLIVEAEPVPPQQLNPQIPRDLETICLKCLEKESGKRYSTAQELAEDLGRFLCDEPIHARPVSRLEHAWRWCRRKPALAGSLAAAAILLLAVLIGSPIAIYRINQARNAEAAERQNAQTEATRAEAEALKARQFQYASDMNLAHQAVQDGDLFRAHQLLDRHRPEFVVPPSGGSVSDRSLARPDRLKAGLQTDLRGWEWRYLWEQTRGQERFILGIHTNGATAVGFLPDGTVFSAGRDKFVRLWNLESHQQVDVLEHPEEVIGAAASPDGRWLATVTENVREYIQPVRLWDLRTRQIAAILATNFWPRSTLVFSPDSKLLAWVDENVGVHLCEIATRREITNLPAYYPFIGPLGVAFSPDGRTLAYNEDASGLIRLWDVAHQSPLGLLAGHKRAVWVLSFSPNGQVLASGARDWTARIWRLSEQRELFSVNNPRGILDNLAFSPSGRFLAIGGWEQQIRLIDVQTGVPISELQGHLKAVTGLAYSLDGQMLLSASLDGTVRVWDAAPHPKTPTAQPLPPDVSIAWNTYGPALCLAPDGRSLLTIHTNQTFRLWDTLKLTAGARHPLPFTNTTIAAAAPGGQLAAFASDNGEVTLWDAESGRSRFLARPETNAYHRLTFSPDGRRLATGGYDTIRVFDVAARKQTHALWTDGQFVKSLAISQDSESLIAGFESGEVKLWRLSGATNAVTLLGHERQVRGLALLPDSQTLISTSEDIRFWDVRQRHEKANLTPRVAWFFACALSPDGRRLAAGASDGSVTIWDVNSLQEVATLKRHVDFVRHLAFTPDGNNLVSVSEDQVCVWRAATIQETDEGTKPR